MIRPVSGAVYERVDDSDVGGVPIRYSRLLRLDIHDLTDKLSVETNLQRMDDITLEDEGELGDVWSIDQLASHRSKSGYREFVNISA